MFVLSILGCLSTPPSSPSGLDSTSGLSSPPLSSHPTDPGPASLACTAVTGTRHVWLFSRKDPSIVALPTDPPNVSYPAASMAGPDALGRLYLDDGDHELLRSDDQGCTWQMVSVLPDSHALLTSASTERLYSMDFSGEETRPLFVSEDGGQTFALLTEEMPGWPIGVLGGTPDELRTYDQGALYGSTDGGSTWSVITSFPEQAGYLSVDPTDLDRVILSKGSNVWQYDGSNWTLQTPDPTANVKIAQWKEDDLVLLAQREDNQVLLRSETGTAPFTEIDWGYTAGYTASNFAVEGTQLVVAGTYEPELPYAPFEGFVAIVDGLDVHVRQQEGMSGVVGVALTHDVIAVGLRAGGDREDD